MRAAIAVVFALLAVANAQMIPWANPFANSTAASTVVKQCKGGGSQCWEQTAGQPDVTITQYSVASNKFPCTSGTTATTLTFDLKVALKAGECKARCEGFGCNDQSLQVCGADFGFPQCPQPAGTVTGTGRTTDCQAGFGDYTITITCPQFEFVTYIAF